MSPEAQRIAIAEACGWKWRQVHNGMDGTQRPMLLPPCGSFGIYMPDYLSDLNAMHEAEKALDDNIEDASSLRYVYAHFLYQICGDEQQPMRATAAQRAEAFLRTLNLYTT